MHGRALSRCLSVLGLTAAMLVAPVLPASTASVTADGTPAMGRGYSEYVALGDSYSAGPLIPQQRPDLIGCVRSSNNYPSFLATYFGLPLFTDVTCSGARSSDMFERQETIVPGPAPAPQLDALTPTTDLVTLGIGGNDYGLFGSLISDCQEVAASDPEGSPCRDMYTVDGMDTKKRDARLIRWNVAEVVQAIRERSPQADVFVLGYPRLLPEEGTCPEVPFAAGDYDWGNELEETLNRSIRLAAEQNGATYVDLYPASEGHDICAGEAAWINGAELKPTEAADFHPFLEGMRGISRAAFRQITGLEAPSFDHATAPAAPQTAPVDEEQVGHLEQQFHEGLEDYVLP